MSARKKVWQKGAEARLYEIYLLYNSLKSMVENGRIQFATDTSEKLIIEASRLFVLLENVEWGK